MKFVFPALIAFYILGQVTGFKDIKNYSNITKTLANKNAKITHCLNG